MECTAHDDIGLDTTWGVGICVLMRLFFGNTDTVGREILEMGLFFSVLCVWCEERRLRKRKRLMVEEIITNIEMENGYGETERNTY